jgi:hypothetical protein
MPVQAAFTLLILGGTFTTPAAVTDEEGDDSDPDDWPKTEVREPLKKGGTRISRRKYSRPSSDWARIHRTDSGRRGGTARSSASRAAPFEKIRQMAARGDLPSRLLTCKIPRCAKCMYDKASRRPGAPRPRLAIYLRHQPRHQA